ALPIWMPLRMYALLAHIDNGVFLHALLHQAAKRLRSYHRNGQSFSPRDYRCALRPLRASAAFFVAFTCSILHRARKAGADKMSAGRGIDHAEEILSSDRYRCSRA